MKFYGEATYWHNHPDLPRLAQHVREQMETFGHQLEELRELTTNAVKEGSRTAASAMQAPLHMPSGT